MTIVLNANRERSKIPTWRAFAPISVWLETEELSGKEFVVSRYNEEQLKSILGDDVCYWSEVNFDLDYKFGYWLRLEVEADSSGDAWNKSVEKAKLFFETLTLYKTMFSVLSPAGLLVKGNDPGLTGHFGWENTILGKPRYFLEKSEYGDLIQFFAINKKFEDENKYSTNSSQFRKRIFWAKYYLRKAYETMNLNERYIFLSIALEALCGEGETELKYRYANRAALLLGDDIGKRKEYYNFVLKAYDTRSKIIHGSVKWEIKIEEVLNYTEIIRQMILRCISLDANNYVNIGKVLDDCLHDTTRHAEVLEKSKLLFGSISEYKKPQLVNPIQPGNFRVRVRN